MPKEDESIFGKMIEAYNSVMPPDYRMCNEAFGDGCGCSLSAFHKGPHEALGVDGQTYHTWET
jgi:hypothetical protein